MQSFKIQGAAVALCFISAWVFKTYNDFGHLTESTLILLPASIVLGIGIFMFIVGLLGFIAVCKEHKLLLSIVSNARSEIKCKFSKEFSVQERTLILVSYIYSVSC